MPSKIDQVLEEYPRRTPESYFFGNYRRFGSRLLLLLYVGFTISIYFASGWQDIPRQSMVAAIVGYGLSIIIFPPCITWAGVIFNSSYDIPYLFEARKTFQELSHDQINEIKKIVAKQGFAPVENGMYKHRKRDIHLILGDTFIIAPFRVLQHIMQYLNLRSHHKDQFFPLLLPGRPVYWIFTRYIWYHQNAEYR